MPKPSARRASGCFDWSPTGSEIAHWLFWQKNTTGASKLAAKTRASFTSPSLVAPSPKYATLAASVPSQAAPMA